MGSPKASHDARWRVLAAVLAGLLVAALTAWLWQPAFSPLLGWTCTAAVYVLTTWAAVGRMDADATAAHATRETPGAWGIHLFLLLAALGSLGGIALLFLGPHGSRLTVAGLSVLVILASWATVQTIHALRYAREYYAHGGGIDFHGDEEPRYSDFAYVAFTVGMSFAISDTDLSTTAMRKIALGHALLAYLFGTVFVAALVNIVASLAG